MQNIREFNQLKYRGNDTYLLIRLPVKIPWVSFLGDLCASNVFSTAVAWAVTLCLPVLYNPKVTSSLNCKMRSYNALTNCNKTFKTIRQWSFFVKVKYYFIFLCHSNNTGGMNMVLWWHQTSLSHWTETSWTLLTLLLSSELICFFPPTLTKAFEKALYNCFGRGVDSRTRDEMITAAVLNQLGTARWFRLSRASSALCLPLATLKL